MDGMYNKMSENPNGLMSSVSVQTDWAVNQSGAVVHRALSDE